MTVRTPPLTCPLSQQPVTWQPSKDGERLIGRILLNKRMKDGTVPADTGALLGLKVTSWWRRRCGGAAGVFMLLFSRWLEER